MPTVNQIPATCDLFDDDDAAAIVFAALADDRRRRAAAEAGRGVVRG